MKAEIKSDGNIHIEPETPAEALAIKYLLDTAENFNRLIVISDIMPASEAPRGEDTTA